MPVGCFQGSVCYFWVVLLGSSLPFLAPWVHLTLLPSFPGLSRGHNKHFKVYIHIVFWENKSYPKEFIVSSSMFSRYIYLWQSFLLSFLFNSSCVSQRLQSLHLSSQTNRCYVTTFTDWETVHSHQHQLFTRDLSLQHYIVPLSTPTRSHSRNRTNWLHCCMKSFHALVGKQEKLASHFSPHPAQ